MGSSFSWSNQKVAKRASAHRQGLFRCKFMVTTVANTNCLSPYLHLQDHPEPVGSAQQIRIGGCTSMHKPVKSVHPDDSDRAGNRCWPVILR